MRIIIGLAKALTLLTLTAVLFQQSAHAQTARKFGDKPITVRLCPSTCRAVNGHGLVPGGPVQVYESRRGWSRVSAYLDRAVLVPSFGNKITKKPALWVPNSTLASQKSTAKPVVKRKQKAKAKPKAVAKKAPAARRVSIVDRVARLRRVPRPTFRPNSIYAQRSVAVTTTEPVVTQPVVVEKIEEPVAKAVVVDTAPVTSVAKGSGSQAALSWEEVQAKIAAQGGQATQRTVIKTEAVPVVNTQSAEEIAQRRAREAKAAEAAAAKALADEAAAARAKAAAAAAQASQPATAKKQVAVVLPPKQAPAVTTEEPTFKSATADPISFGARPKKLTKKLLDKRLKKLPGRKSKIRKDVVIALRHYALGLLNSGECKGIAKGGASAAPGMLYVACTDDPTYLRQFPLVEESW